MVIEQYHMYTSSLSVATQWHEIVQIVNVVNSAVSILRLQMHERLKSVKLISSVDESVIDLQ